MTTAFGEQSEDPGAEPESSPSSSLEVGAQKVIEGQHVLLLAELHVVGDALQDLGHEHEAAFDLGTGLTVDDAHFVGRHCRQRCLGQVQLRRLPHAS